MPILLKRSASAGKVPTIEQLSLGELAVNTHDGRLFLKRDNGAEVVIELAALEAGVLTLAALHLANWSLEQNGATLELRHDGVTRLKLDSSGNLTVTGDVTAFGTP